MIWPRGGHVRGTELMYSKVIDSRAQACYDGCMETKMTLAARISQRFGHGQKWERGSVGLTDLLERIGAEETTLDSERGVCLYALSDGSGILTCGDFWDARDETPDAVDLDEVRVLSAAEECGLVVEAGDVTAELRPAIHPDGTLVWTTVGYDDLIDSDQRYELWWRAVTPEGVVRSIGKVSA